MNLLLNLRNKNLKNCWTPCMMEFSHILLDAFMCDNSLLIFRLNEWTFFHFDLNVSN